MFRQLFPQILLSLYTRSTEEPTPICPRLFLRARLACGLSQAINFLRRSPAQLDTHPHHSPSLGEMIRLCAQLQLCLLTFHLFLAGFPK